MGMKGPDNNNNRYLDVIQFELRPEDTQRLIESGQNAVLNYFRNRNFPKLREVVINQDQQGNYPHNNVVPPRP